MLLHPGGRGGFPELRTIAKRSISAENSGGITNTYWKEIITEQFREFVSTHVAVGYDSHYILGQCKHIPQSDYCP
jgi:hypothetical protein